MPACQLWPDQGGPNINYISSPPPDLHGRRKLAILGSTGSIGQNCLQVCKNFSDRLEIHALAGGQNIALLAQQANFFKPPLLAVQSGTLAGGLKERLAQGYNPKIYWGKSGYETLAKNEDVQIVLSAQSGAAGLPATLQAVLAGKIVALANKESLVLAGALVRKICSVSGAAILPVDSEHFAIFQCLAGRGQIAGKLVITASGGPFRGMRLPDLARIKAADALRHPTWKMGKKISIDSATLMNKGLELIEAAHLFGVTPNRIEILIHPQSIIHSLVKFGDNSLLAQLAVPNMRLPIGDCLLWPHSAKNCVQELNLPEIGNLTFERPDSATFKCLELARQAVNYQPDASWRKLGLNPACIVLNAANEQAVQMFLEDQCGFNDIPLLVGEALRQCVFADQPRAPELPAAGGLNQEVETALAAIEKLSAQAVQCIAQESLQL